MHYMTNNIGIKLDQLLIYEDDIISMKYINFWVYKQRIALKFRDFIDISNKSIN